MKKILLLLVALSFVNYSFAAAKHKKQRHKKSQTVTSTKTKSKTKSKLKHPSKKSLKKSKLAKQTAPKITNIAKITTSSTIPSTKVNQDAINNQPRLYSYSALAVDANNGEVYVSKNPTIRLPIASITKLMTAMVVLDSGADLDGYVTIKSDDVDNLRNTFSRLKVGMQLRRRDLLLLALMSSENRAAHALGRTAYPGGINVFIKKMNEKAVSLGMKNTKFYDPTGLTHANQSTAEDLSKMVEAAFNYDLIKDYTTTKSASVILGPHYVHRYINSDALVRIGKFPIALSKTGFINEAGHCLVLYSHVDGKPIIMVFLNSTGKSGRLVDAIAVKNYIQKIT